MQNLDNLIILLTKKILDSNSDLPLKILNQLNSSFSQSELEEIQKSIHKKFHKNIQLPLNSCKEPHCVECLSISARCEHGAELTLFEKHFSSHLTKQCKNRSENLNPSRLCKSCKFSNPAEVFLKKTCKCECIFCIKFLLNREEMACSICRTNYDLLDLVDMFIKLGIEFPGLLKKCESCGLLINSSGFLGETCYVCSQFNEFIINRK